MLIAIKENGLWGFFNLKNQQIIACIYDSVQDFKDGTAIVQINRLNGVIDEEGKEIIPCVYSKIERKENGIFKVTSGIYSCFCNSRGDLIDNRLIPLSSDLQKFDIAQYISDDFFYVKKGDERGITCKDKLVFSSKYDVSYICFKSNIIQVSYYVPKKYTRYDAYHVNGKPLVQDAYQLSIIDGVCLIVSQNYEEGYNILNFNGTKLLQKNYKDIHYLGGNLFKLECELKNEKQETEQNYIFDIKAGSIVDEFEYKLSHKLWDTCDNYSDGYAIVSINNKYGFIDTEGNLKVPCIYSGAKRCHSDIVIVRDEGWHLLNLQTNIKSKSFSTLNELENGYFIYSEESRYYCGVVNADGDIIVPARYNDDIKYLQNGMFEASRGHGAFKTTMMFNQQGQIVLAAPNGNVTLSKDIISVGNFSEGLAIVENIDGKKGYINEAGQLVIPCKYPRDCYPFESGMAMVEFGKKDSLGILIKTDTIFINKEGAILVKHGKTTVPFKTDFLIIKDYFDDAAAAFDGNNWGLIDSNGTLISEMAYNSITYWKNGFYIVEKNNRKGILNKTGKLVVECKYIEFNLKDDELIEAIIKRTYTGAPGYGSKEIESVMINKDGLIVVHHGNNIVLLSPHFDYAEDFDGDFAKVRIDGQWGLVNVEGQVVLECQFNEINNIFNGYAICSHDGKKFLVNIISKEQIDITEIGGNAWYYNDNCIVVKSTRYDSYWIINKFGEKISAEKFSYIGNYLYGLAPVAKTERDTKYNYTKKYGLIDESGNEVIPVQYYSLEILNGNLFRVAINDKNCSEGEKYRYINLKNEIGVLCDDKFITLPSKYKSVGEYKNGFVRVAIDNPQKGSDNKYYYYNHPDEYEDEFLSELYAPITGNVADDDGKKYSYLWGYINAKGIETIPCKYLKATDFNYGHAVIALLSDIDDFRHRSEQYGIINTYGEIIIPCEYSNLSILSNSFIKAQKNNRCGIIDFSNNIVIPFDYDNIKDAGGNCFIIALSTESSDSRKSPHLRRGKRLRISAMSVTKPTNPSDYLWGLIDLNNNMIIQPQYREFRDFHDGLAAVHDDNGWKFIDEKGSTIINCGNNNYVGDFVDGKAAIIMSHNETKREFSILKNGHLLVDNYELDIDLEKLSFIDHFYEGMARAIYNDEWVFFNTFGKIVIENIGSSVENFIYGYAKLSEYEGDQFIDKEGHLTLFNDNQKITFPIDYRCAIALCDSIFVATYKNREYNSVIDSNMNILFSFSDNCTLSMQTMSVNEKNEEDYIMLNDEWNDVQYYFDKQGRRIIPGDKKIIYISQDYGPSSTFSEGLAAVSKGGLWGFVDEDGNEVIPCKFSSTDSFNGGYSVVYNDDKELGIIDKNGNQILPFRAYDSVTKFHDNKAIVSHRDFGVMHHYEGDEYNDPENTWESEKRTINTNGNIVIPLYGEDFNVPKEYDWSDDSFKEGFLSVHKDGKWGVIDTSLNLIVPCIYDEKIVFTDGIAVASKEDKTYYLDSFGRILSDENYAKLSMTQPVASGGVGEKKYAQCRGYGSGLILISKAFTDKSRPNFFFKRSRSEESITVFKWGYADKNGDIVIECKYNKAEPFSHGVARVRNSERKWALLASNGKELTDFVYDEISEFVNGRMTAKIRDKEGVNYLNEQGAILLDVDNNTNQPIIEIYGYDWVTEQHNGYSIVYKGKLQGIIDNRGFEICPLKDFGDRVIDFDEHDNLIIKKQLYHNRRYITIKKFFSSDGRILTYNGDSPIKLPNIIHWAGEWIDGYITVLMYDKWGLMDVDLNFVIDPLYDKIQYISDKKVFCVKNEEETTNYYIYDIENKSVKPLIYETCSDYENGHAIVSKVIEVKTESGRIVEKTVYGIIDNVGEETLQCIYQNARFREPPKEKNDNYDNVYDDMYYGGQYSRYDSLMDALDGELDARWNID